MTLPAKTADTHLQALQVGNRVDFLAEPAAHLHAGIAARETNQTLRAIEFVHQVIAATVVEPGIDLTSVEAERNTGTERIGRVFAPKIVGSRMAHFDCTIGDGIDSLQRRDNFATGEHLNIKVSVRGRLHMVRHGLGGTKNGVKRFRE